MLSLSVGSIFLGNIQDKKTESEVVAFDDANGTQIAGTYLEDKSGLLGDYKALDGKKTTELANQVAIFEAEKKVKDNNGSKESQDELAGTIRNIFRSTPPAAPDKNATQEVKDAHEKEKDAWTTTLEKRDDAKQKAYLEGKGLFVSEEVYAKAKADKTIIDTALHKAKKNALFTAAIFPLIMLVVYLGFLRHFANKGGYKPVEILASSSSSSDKDADES